MKKQLFSGTGVALVTPFKNRVVDYDQLKNIIEYCIAGGVDYLVSLGTTGEAVTLTTRECRQVFDFTIQVADGRLPIVAGIFGGNDTRNLVNRIKDYDFDGFDGVLSSSPAYSKPTQEGIFQHYMSIAEVCPKPIIMYNVPGRTSSNMTAETIVRLANASDKFVAVKEASGDMVQGAQIIKHKPAHFQVLSGDDPTCLPLMSCGATGVISVISNAFPWAFSTMVNAALKDDFTLASQLHLALIDLHKWLYIDGNPAGIKGVMEELGFCTREVRLPLVPISDQNFDHLKKALQKAQIALKGKTITSKV